MLCAVESDLNRYLLDQERQDAFEDRCCELQDELTADFLRAKISHPDADEIFCNILVSDHFRKALQSVFSSHAELLKPMRKPGDSDLAAQVAQLFKICHDAALPHFEKEAEEATEAEMRDEP